MTSNLFAAIEAAAHDGAFGQNSRPTPTDAQCAAGNYKVGRVAFHGFPLVIEPAFGRPSFWWCPYRAAGSIGFPA